MITDDSMAAPETRTLVTRNEWVALVALVAVVVLFEALWLARDPVPDLTNDDQPIARLAFAWAQHWTSGVPVLPEQLSSTPYPPLPSLLGALGIVLRPDQPVLGMLQAHGVYISVLVVGTWAAVRRDLGAPAALAAAVLAPSYAWWAGRGQMHVDVHQGACLVALLGAWRWSDGLQRVGPALLAGLAVGAGLLTKFSFVFFAAVPAAWMVADALASVSRHRGVRTAVLPLGLIAAGCIVGSAAGRVAPVAALIMSVVALGAVGVAWRVQRAPTARRALAGVIAFVAGASVAAPWYLANLLRLRGFLDANLAHTFAGEVLPLADVWWVYPSVLARAVLDTPFCVAMLVGTVVAARGTLGSIVGRVTVHPVDGSAPRSPPNGAVVWLAWSMVACGIAALTLQPYRTPRYIFPAAAPCLVIAAWAFACVDRRRTPVAALVGAWGVWLWCSAPWVLAHPDPVARADWWARVVLVPPNSEHTVAQLRVQALARTPDLRATLPGPSPSPFGFSQSARAAAARVDLVRVRTVATDGLPDAACATFTLAMIARGVSPYVRCGGPDADLRVVTGDAPPRIGEADGGGPYDRTRVRLRYASWLDRP